MATEKENEQNLRRVQAYNDRRKLILMDLWREGNLLAELTGNLSLLDAEPQEPARLKALLALLQQVNTELQFQERQEVERHVCMLPDFEQANK